jgi:hypothetical protein
LAVKDVFLCAIEELRSNSSAQKNVAEQKRAEGEARMPNPFKVVQRSGFIRPMNPETSGQKILDYPGKARRLFAEYKSRFNFCQEKFSPALFQCQIT